MGEKSLGPRNTFNSQQSLLSKVVAIALYIGWTQCLLNKQCPNNFTNNRSYQLINTNRNTSPDVIYEQRDACILTQRAQKHWWIVIFIEKNKDISPTGKDRQ